PWDSSRDQPVNGAVAEPGGAGRKEASGGLRPEPPGPGSRGQAAGRPVRPPGIKKKGSAPGGIREPHPSGHRGRCEQILHRTLLSLFDLGPFGQAGCMVDWLSRFRPMHATMWRAAVVDHGTEVSSPAALVQRF